jgi:hypothetical protein
MTRNKQECVALCSATPKVAADEERAVEAVTLSLFELVFGSIRIAR